MTESSSHHRRHDVDALRLLAVLLLVPFHTARLFDAEPWHMKDLDAPYWAADFLIRSLNVAQMSLLFLLAGMSAAWALQRRSPGAFLKERAARLLLPLLIGIFLLALPQVWLERISPQVPLRMSPQQAEGGFLAFLGDYLTCCYPVANLSWHHLWFLPYLFVYCVPLVLLAGSGGAAGLARWTARAPWRLFLFGLSLIAVELALRPTFPSSHNLVWDWANHAHYALLVLFGWWLGRNPVLEAALLQVRRSALAAALLFAALWFAAMDPQIGGFGLIELSHPLRHVARTAAEWCLLLALLAYGRLLFTAPLVGLWRLVPLILPLYLFHQTVIVFLGWLWLDWTGAPWVKAAAIGGASLALSVVLAWGCSRFALTRVATGLPLHRRAPSRLQGSPAA
ncbi:MAG: acyltransferase family protein [Rhodospirillales bacterium]